MKIIEIYHKVQHHRIERVNLMRERKTKSVSAKGIRTEKIIYKETEIKSETALEGKTYKNLMK